MKREVDADWVKMEGDGGDIGVCQGGYDKFWIVLRECAALEKWNRKVKGNQLT